jgi:hypothetical protein
MSNRGLGAGGFNTNFNGKNFENSTNITELLISNGYKSKTFNNKCFFYKKELVDKTIVFVSQTNFKKYMKIKYNLPVIRNPDEACIIEYKNGKKILKILEKKCQNVNGSVETKLWSGPSLKREYEIIYPNFEIDYSYCVNNFLENKICCSDIKWIIFNKILLENNINIFYKNDDNYKEQIYNWFIGKFNNII